METTPQTTSPFPTNQNTLPPPQQDQPFPSPAIEDIISFPRIKTGVPIELSLPKTPPPLQTTLQDTLEGLSLSSPQAAFRNHDGGGDTEARKGLAEGGDGDKKIGDRKGQVRGLNAELGLNTKAGQAMDKGTDVNEEEERSNQQHMPGSPVTLRQAVDGSNGVSVGKYCEADMEGEEDEDERERERATPLYKRPMGRETEEGWMEVDWKGKEGDAEG